MKKTKGDEKFLKGYSEEVTYWERSWVYGREIKIYEENEW